MIVANVQIILLDELERIANFNTEPPIGWQ
jgi:hypothetical protein